MLNTITIPAGGSQVETCPNLVLTILTCSLPFTIVFNGAGSEAGQSGQVFDKRLTGGFQYISFINPNATDITVSYDVGKTPASYQPVQKNASTRSVGNPVTSLITNATLTVPGTNNGNQRQQIVISVSAGTLTLSDSNGNVFDTITALQTKTYVTDATFVLSNPIASHDGTVFFSIGELYYNS